MPKHTEKFGVFEVAVRSIISMEVFEGMMGLSTHPYWGTRPAELWLAFFRHVSSLGQQDVQARCWEAFMSAWASAPLGGTFMPGPRLRLHLTHTCAATACSDAHCALCANSTLRQCTQLFSPKYLVGDELRPACGSEAVAVLMRHDRNELASDADTASLPPFQLQVCALPEDYWRVNEHSMPWAQVPECKTVVCKEANSHSVESVLHCKSGGFVEANGFVTFPGRLAERTAGAHIAPGAVTPMPLLDFRRSAESLLAVKMPNLVLVVRAVDAVSGAPLDLQIAPAASSPFTIATKRVRGAMKSHIPSMDQGVKVLHHIGDACIRKLSDVVAIAASLNLRLPEHCTEVATVADMVALVAANRGDAVLEQRLYGNLLNMNEDKWEQLRSQLSRAVEPDSRMRAFLAGPVQPPFPGAPLPEGLVDVGLLFKCERGCVDQTGAKAIIMRSRQDGLQCLFPLEHAHGVPGLVAALHRAACKTWVQPAHPGWSIFHGVSGPCDALPQLLQMYCPRAPQPSAAPWPSLLEPTAEATGAREAHSQAWQLPSSEVRWGNDFLQHLAESADPFDTCAVQQQIAEEVAFSARDVLPHQTGPPSDIPVPLAATPALATALDDRGQGARRDRSAGIGSAKLPSGRLEQRRSRWGGLSEPDVFHNSVGATLPGSALGAISFGSLLAFDSPSRQLQDRHADRAMRSAQELEKHGLAASDPCSNCNSFFLSRDTIDPYLDQSMQRLMQPGPLGDCSWDPNLEN